MTTTKPATDQPFDANGECRECDEQLAHRADCPWLLRLIEENQKYLTWLEAEQMKTEVAEKDAEIEKLREDQKMLAQTIRNMVVALGDADEDWQGSVADGVDRINANIELTQAYIRALADDRVRLRRDLQKGEQVFEAVVHTYEGDDDKVPADLRDASFVKRAREHRRVKAEEQTKAMKALRIYHAVADGPEER